MTNFLNEEPNVVTEILEDGRRRQVVKSVVTDAENGTTTNVSEVHEEVLPMRMTQRTTRTLKAIPVEEKVEKFHDDGSVQTTVKSLTEESGIDYHMLSQIRGDLDQIKNHLGHAPKSTCAKAPQTEKGFLAASKAMFNAPSAPKGDTGVATDPQYGALSWIGWTIVAVLLGAVVYVLI